MKQITLATLVLGCISGIMSLPAGYNTGTDAVSAQYPPWGQFSPELLAYIQAITANSQPQGGYASQQTTYVSATPPAAGVNVGGGTGGKVGTITTTTPANSGGGVINVPAGSSVTVTGENGSVSGAGAANQGNGGSITVTAGSGNGSDSSSSTDNGSGASTADSS